MSSPTTEDAFVEQYRDLDDETLRKIARGTVPWRDEQQYVHAARRAARSVLRSRGADEIPRVPSWDGNGPLPRWVQRVVILSLLVVAGGVIALGVGTVPDRIDDAAACTHVRSVIRASDWGHRVQIHIPECSMDIEGGVESSELKRPVMVRACLQITDATLQRWSQREHQWECRRVQPFLSDKNRFVCGDSAPASLPAGDLCTEAWVHVADVVERTGQPWRVHFRVHRQ